MSIFNIGPDGLILVEALIVSVLVAVLAWRRVDLTAGITAVVATVVALVLLQARSPYATPDFNHRVVTAAFVAVPSALLLGASRVKWLARHAWVLVLAGPILFVGCYVGICELCVKTGLI
jgi:peptidoglycan/LPS O-acetylase OafA/YrhL